MTVGPTQSLYRVPRDYAHGKEIIAVADCAVYSLPCAAHGKDVAVCKYVFAVCRGHTATRLSPVVHVHARLLIGRDEPPVRRAHDDAVAQHGIRESHGGGTPVHKGEDRSGVPI